MKARERCHHTVDKSNDWQFCGNFRVFYARRRKKYVYSRGQHALEITHIKFD